MKTLTFLAFLCILGFTCAQSTTYFTDKDGEQDGDCVNEVIEYAVDVGDGYGFLWSAICEKDEVSDDCEFWAYEFVLDGGALDEAFAGESTASTDNVYTPAENGSDDLITGLCV